MGWHPEWNKKRESAETHVAGSWKPDCGNEGIKKGQTHRSKPRQAESGLCMLMEMPSGHLAYIMELGVTVS